MFEIIPLTVNCIATLILLFLKLFERAYQYADISQIIEILTYFLFCYTFAMISALIKNERRKKMYFI
jgi:hypothetical protein